MWVNGLWVQCTHFISNIDVSKYPFISKKIILTHKIFSYISSQVISNYWYPKVNFLGPENLL